MKDHPLIHTLLTVRGNPKACLYTEPLWYIPYCLYLPFVSVYMQALGLSDSQIGLIASVLMFTMAFFALLSGAITDKLGRKLTTLIFDILSWSVPCVIWAFAQNLWWFLAAAAFNGMMQITANSWTCLLVEDADKKQIVKIYSIMHIIGQLAVFFAPISVAYVNRYSVVPVMRVIYLITFVSMTAKFIILYKYSTETQVGLTRKAETSGMSVFKIMSGYTAVLGRILKSKEMLLALSINAVFNIITMVTGNFFGLYTTGILLVPEHYLGYFPILRAVIIMFFLFFLSEHLHRLSFRRPMLTGIFIYIAAHILLLSAPAGNMLIPFIYILLEACAYSLVMPNKDTLIALLIDPDERARINSIMTSLVLCVSIPFGYLSGWLSENDRHLPFVLNIILYVLIFIVILIGGKRADKKSV